ncbi:MAG: hypothetical protein JXQ83_07650 [Candidatus Glassbacteria bacterium]|nr:hypothetical protein [Candidatus Glassbacteria bacterium]
MGKDRKKKGKQQPAADKLDAIRNAITDGGKSSKSVVRAFQSLMRQDEDRDNWAAKEFHRPDAPKKR